MMSSELSEIINFVQSIPPFDVLTEPAMESLVNNIKICYVRNGDKLPPKEVDEPRLYLIRKGVLTHLGEAQELIEKYSEGDLCVEFCFAGKAKSANIYTEEDTLLYSISYTKLLESIRDFPEAVDFFNHTAEQRLNKKMSRVNEEAIISSSLMNASVSDFYHTPAASISSNATIQDAAIKMTDLGFSCLVIIEAERAIGIVTDKDMRRRCVAGGVSSQQKITEIMTANMATIDIKSNAYDALIAMTNKKIHHLPVMSRGQLAGMLTVTDLMNHEGHNAINFTSIIHRAVSINELVSISRMLPQLQIRMAKLGTTTDHVAKSISAITMAFTIRLIEMAENALGDAPVSFAWLAAGSQARQEQLAHSDQDNALIISEEVKPEHDYWFHDFATFVSDGLAACGFIYCPGDVMATNPKWRQKQSVWTKYFDQWITKPEPKALMYCSIFFDLETVYGDASLLEDVRQTMLRKTRQSTLFIAHLSGNALKNKPPLGFFRDFVLIQNEKNKAALDLKHNAIALIVDLARIYALSEGIAAVNTLERLKQAGGTPSLSSSSAANLIDAFEFMGMLRLKHQARQLQSGEKPDNFLAPKEISRLERQHLKDAFKVIKTMQDNRQSI